MYANILKFHILIPHEQTGDSYFFLIPIISYFRVFPFDKITLKSHIFVLLLPSWASSVGVKAVLESGSWRHSVLQTPALVFFLLAYVGVHKLAKENTMVRKFTCINMILSLFFLNMLRVV